MDIDVAHASYLMEHTALALNPTPVAIRLTCRGPEWKALGAFT